MAFAQLPAPTGRRNSKTKPLLLLGLLVVLGIGVLRMQQLTDYVRAFGYTPSAQVAQLAADDGFTPYARHLYTINRTQIDQKATFSTECSGHQEQTIVLGCYHSVQHGIFILQITDDSRLNGVMQVTAAHEMLHAAYDRLSSKDRARVDGWLQDYYDHDLTDTRIRQTIEAYKQSEPNDVVNEMHSVFGTEVGRLPAPLENYYKRYFTDRQKIVAYADGYQAAFTSREQQVAAYDAQLASLKARIDTDQSGLNRQAADLDDQQQQMRQLKNSGQTGAYNAQVSSYNAAVDTYNALVDQTKQLISQYNQIVARRNAIALQHQQLVSELSGNGVSTIDNQ